MDFSLLIDRDITFHTAGHKFRGVLVEILVGEPRKGVSNEILGIKMGVDDFYLDSSHVIAVTVHGREFGTEVKFEHE